MHLERPTDIRCVLFDFDGTLANTEDFGLALDQEVYETYGIEPTREEMLSLVGTSGFDSIPALFRRYGMEVTAQEFFSRRRENISIYRDMPIRVHEGARELLAGLRERGVLVGLVSTTEAQSLVIALNRLGLMSCFDAMVTGDLVKRHKPDPEPYRRALELLGVAPENTVVVEDSTTGVAASKAAGLYTLAYVGGDIPQDVSAADELVPSYVGFSI